MEEAADGGASVEPARRTMNSIEMTDRDGDALTVISQSDRTWITCTSGAEEVTVGPFPTPQLRTVLAALDGAAEAVS